CLRRSARRSGYCFWLTRENTMRRPLVPQLLVALAAGGSVQASAAEPIHPPRPRIAITYRVSFTAAHRVVAQPTQAELRDQLVSFLHAKLQGKPGRHSIPGDVLVGTKVKYKDTPAARPSGFDRSTVSSKVKVVLHEATPELVGGFAQVAEQMMELR